VIRKNVAIGIAAAGFLLLAGLSSRAEDEDNSAALAKALPQARNTLEQGLKASGREGKPISAKYEIDDGVLQLSVYTMKGGRFIEVVVDHKSGTIKKAETITDADDMKDAQEQSATMAKAKLTLDAAVRRATTANAGYRAVSVIPMLQGGRTIADVTLVRGNKTKKVAEQLE
jgi:hypothetical protein